MKKIVISRHQLLKLNEESNNQVNVAVQPKDDTISSYAAAVTSPNALSDIQKAKSAGDVNVVVRSSKSTDKQPTQVVLVPQGQSVGEEMNNQLSQKLLDMGSPVIVQGDGIGESYVFTKKALREARLAKIKREGKVYTKKELTERFLNNL
jgi:hypothetical protein